jgi:predicted lactoylglutathione lyase
MIFVNLPVADLEASRRFFTEVGHTFHESFCDDRALAMRIGAAGFAMLLPSEVFAGFTPRSVADAHAVTEVVIGLAADSPESVDALVGRAVAAGGTAVRTVAKRGPDGACSVYGRSYADLDGHVWEVFWSR